jgi:acyl-coenzyme A synthetase/AMP-(fatty) acid ligase
LSIVDQILHFARVRPEAPALVEDERVLAYGELGAQILRTAAHLSDRGITPGERIGLCLKDSAAHLVAFLGAAQAGAVPVSLDWRATPAENAGFVEALGLRQVLVEPDARLAGLPLDQTWRDAVAACRPSVQHSPGWNDAFAISASSGSTGTPKFTQMTHLQYHFAVTGMLELMGLAGRHRYLSTLPLYYSGGRNSCIAHLLRGDCVILYPSLFSAREYVQVAAHHRATAAVLVPTMVRQLLAADAAEPLLPGLAVLFCTGAPLHAEEKRSALRRLTPNFHERYGAAETLVLTVLRPADMQERAGSIGQPHSLVRIEVVDEDHQPLPHGVAGQLRFRGPGLATPLPGQPVPANFRNGWCYPGEVAQIDQSGYVFLQGRLTDVIMRSGAKIFPAEVEAVLCQHPGVVEAAVLGHQAGAEEEVAAFVVARGALSPGELLAHCRVRLSAHKVPRQLRLVGQLPRNTSGKIDKPALLKLLQDG